MTKKPYLSMLLVAFSVASLSACSSKTETAADSNTVRIGVFAPLTGANAGAGELEKRGTELANALYPTVNGKKIELVIADNKSDKVEAANAVTRLIEKDKVSAIIGSYGSSLSMAAGSVVQQAKVPTMGTSPTNPLVTEGNEYYYRVCFIDPFQGTVMSNYAVDNLKASRVAIIQEVSNDYAVGLAKFFTDNFKKRAGKDVVAVANYNTGDQDFSAQLTTIKASKPDAIFAPGNFTETALIIKQARQLGITVPFIGGDTWETPEFIKIGGKDVEGATFSSFFASEKPITAESTKFIDAYKAKFNEEPSAGSALGYDAYLIIYKAMEAAKASDSASIQTALKNTKDFEGAAGIVNFDANRNAIKSAVLKTVKDGKFVFTAVVEPVK